MNNNPVNYVDPWGLYGRNWVKEHNIAAGKEIDSNTILDVDKYMHFLWDVARYTMEDTWNDISEFDYCHFWECINKDRRLAKILSEYFTWKMAGEITTTLITLTFAPEAIPVTLNYLLIADESILAVRTSKKLANLINECKSENKR